MSHISDGPEDRSPFPNALAFGGGGGADDDEDAPSDSSLDVASSRWRWFITRERDRLRHSGHIKIMTKNEIFGIGMKKESDLMRALCPNGSS